MARPTHPAPTLPDTATEEWCLLGPRQLDHLMDQVSAAGADSGAPSRSQLAERWRAAVAVYEDLAQTEAGAADDAGIRPLPPSMAGHIQRLTELEGVRRTFDTVPVAFGLVELDKLVVSQYSMTRAVVDRIVQTHPLPLSPRRLVQLCLPLEAPAASFQLASQHGREFTFVSDAHDMRFLDAQVVSPLTVNAQPVMGHPQAVVALSVGFSANLLNVVRYNGRVVINNGHHRALALRRMGFTHAPCLIQPCASHAELQQAATSEILRHVDLYFDSPRPPLMRDFDHPLLTLAIRSPRMKRVLTIKVEVQKRLMAL